MDKTLLKTLYRGNITPFDFHVDSEEYKKAQREYNRLFDELENRLSKRTMKKLNRLFEAYTTMEDECLAEMFSIGFSVGARLTSESFFEAEKLK